MKITLLLVILLALILSGCKTPLTTDVNTATPENPDYSTQSSQAELDDLRQQIEQQQQTLNELQTQQEELDRELTKQRIQSYRDRQDALQREAAAAQQEQLDAVREEMRRRNPPIKYPSFPDMSR